MSVISIIFLTDSKNQVKFKTLFKVTDRITRFGVSAIFHSDHENGCAVPPAERRKHVIRPERGIWEERI